MRPNAVTRLDVTAFKKNTVVLGGKFVFELISFIAFNAILTALLQRLLDKADIKIVICWDTKKRFYAPVTI